LEDHSQYSNSRNIYFNLFDEVVVLPRKPIKSLKDAAILIKQSMGSKDETSSLSTSSMASSEWTLERRWLGSFSIPYSTLLESQGNRIEGTFSIERPVTLLGYDSSVVSSTSREIASQGTQSASTRSSTLPVTATQGNMPLSSGAHSTRHAVSGDLLNTKTTTQSEATTLLALFVTLDPPLLTPTPAEPSAFYLKV